MAYSFDTLRDFIGALSLVALLAASYGGVSRRLVGHRNAPAVLGALFGLCASLQMMMPLSPVDGVIVDMRNVPIVLAGAFLGTRGMMLCLIIAISTRISIGGLGMQAGVAGMLIAGIVGFMWHQSTRFVRRLTARHMFALAVAANLHILSGFLVPWEIAVWFFTSAVPLIVVLNLISITLVALLLDLEQRRINEEAVLRTSAWADPDSGLLLPEPFIKELRDIETGLASDPLRGLAIISLRHTSWLRACWGDSALGQVRGALRKRLEPIVMHGRSIGISPTGHILVPITAREFGSDTLAMTLHRAVSEYSVSLDAKAGTKVSIDIDVLPMANTPKSVEELVQKIRRLTHFRHAPLQKVLAARPRLTLVPDTAPIMMLGPVSDKQGQLFAKAELIMNRTKH